MLLGYAFFMIFDRDRLQTEEFQIKSKSLAIIEEKGGAVEILPVALDVANPYPVAKRDRSELPDEENNA
jgi:hypothetical protein